MDLDTIKVLFRAPDSLALYGIPYNMRPGQAPGDIYHAYRAYIPPPYGTYGAKCVDISDWIWLGGSTGWWGSMTRDQQADVQAFLARQGDLVPENPNEWSEVSL